MADMGTMSDWVLTVLAFGFISLVLYLITH